MLFIVWLFCLPLFIDIKLLFSIYIFVLCFYTLYLSFPFVDFQRFWMYLLVFRYLSWDYLFIKFCLLKDVCDFENE